MLSPLGESRHLEGRLLSCIASSLDNEHDFPSSSLQFLPSERGRRIHGLAFDG